MCAHSERVNGGVMVTTRKTVAPSGSRDDRMPEVDRVGVERGALCPTVAMLLPLDRSCLHTEVHTLDNRNDLMVTSRRTESRHRRVRRLVSAFALSCCSQCAIYCTRAIV